MTDYQLVLKALGEKSAISGDLLRILDVELSLPNLPMPTLGGEVFWNNIAECNGWKLQQNMITHHARILDCNNCRIAWGTITGMERAMSRMASNLRAYDESSIEDASKRQNAMSELKALKELLDIGAITQSEYNKKKETLMNQF